MRENKEHRYKQRVFIKALAVLAAAVMLVMSVPTAALAAEEDAEELEPIVGYTEEFERENDPGYYRLSGQMYLDGNAETQDDFDHDMNPDGVQGKSTGTSPFIGNTYTHNDAHERYLVLHGVDISSYQETINWEKARADGVSFAIVRVGYRGYGSAGTLKEDPYYKVNLTNAPKAGVNTGVYIYSQAITPEEAIEEADFVLSRIKGYKVTLPVVLDFEYASTSKGETGRLFNAKLSKREATDLCLAFCDHVKAAGYDAMVYANKSMLTNQLYAEEISAKYPIWLAHYTISSSYTGDYEYWQYTSSGRVDGMEGPIDCNFRYVFVDATAIDMPEKSVTVEGGSTRKLTARLTPANASNAISWSSSNSSVAQVSSDGEVLGMEPGTATITASIGKLSASCTVTVTVPPVRGVAVEHDSYELGVGSSLTIKANVTPIGAKNKNLKWSVDNPAVATVDQNGVVHGVSGGTANVTVTTEEGGFSKTVAVHVTTRVLTVTLDRSSASIMNGMTLAAKATLIPLGSTGEIEWSSSNEKVATVDTYGVITARGIGSAVITAKAGEAQATMTVTVTGKPIPLRTSVRFGSMASFSIDDLTFELRSTADEQQVTKPEPEPSTVGAVYSFSPYEGEYIVDISKPGFTSYRNNVFQAGSDIFPSTVMLYPGDVNDDGYVNVRDISAELELLGTAEGSGNYTVSGDFDSSGVIDAEDFESMLKGFGQSDNIIS